MKGPTMLRKAVVTLLTKYLGQYVKGLEEKNLKLTLTTSGKLELTDLFLQEDALDDLELPITVKYGNYFITNNSRAGK